MQPQITAHIVEWVGLLLAPGLITVLGLIIVAARNGQSRSRLYNEILVKTQMVYPNFYFAFLKVALIGVARPVTLTYWSVGLLISIVFFGIGVLMDDEINQRVLRRNIVMATMSIVYTLLVIGMNSPTSTGLTGILYQFVREYSEGFERDGGVGQGPAFEALAPYQH